jgi:CDP-2,3-bis-(O-geranylgeranyl)-sn-glycerol synthase
MHLSLILRLLVLLTLANGTPVVINKVLGRRLSYPIDGGVKFVDGKPLFGSSKTIRGVLYSVLVTAVGASLAGWEWNVGAVVGGVAMAGDLFSSFLKRRMGLPAGSRATGLDQVPESLFPLLACRHTLSLTVLDIAVTVALFFVGEVVLSILFYKFHVRERPY